MKRVLKVYYTTICPIFIQSMSLTLLFRLFEILNTLLSVRMNLTNINRKTRDDAEWHTIYAKLAKQVKNYYYYIFLFSSC